MKEEKTQGENIVVENNDNRQINKGFNIKDEAHNLGLNLKSSRLENLVFLAEQIKFLGFGNTKEIAKELVEKMNSNEKTFDIKLNSDKAVFHKADFNLHFKRSEKTDLVFFNSFDTTLTNSKKNIELKHNFSVKNDDFTAKESINLLEGRAVLSSIEKDGEKQKVYFQLNLKEPKDNNGNFQKNIVSDSNFDVKNIVAKENFIFNDENHKNITLKSLEKGNVVNAKFVDADTKKVIEGKAVLNVGYKSINLYDSTFKRLNSNEKAFIKENDGNTIKNQEKHIRKL